MATCLTEMCGITKQFPGVLANDHVNLSINSGEVHAVVGENGAGKSTLMNILFGLYQPDEGEIRLQGTPVVISSPDAAIAHNIGMVHQHFMLVPSFTVADNVVLGRFPRKLGFYDSRKAASAVADVAARYGLNVNPRSKILDLSVGIMQRVEILKALYREAEVLILDEPTAVLTPQEAEELFTVLRGLAAKGKAVILITHKLKEVMAVSNRVTVMRAGRNVGVLETKNTCERELARLMVGREVFFRIEKAPATPGAEILRVENLRVRNAHNLYALNGVSLSVRAGEIVGVAGVEGNGQTELTEALTALRTAEEGRITIKGKDVTKFGVRTRRELGLAHIPEDRMRLGVSGIETLEDNAIAVSYYRWPLSRRALFLRPRQIHEYADTLIADYDVRPADRQLRAGTLSGGNIQKMILGRELGCDPSLVIAAQPTRGLDVGATEYVHSQLLHMRDRGCAILLISADLDEILALSDRVVVMYEGKIVAEVAQEEATEHRLGVLMTGGCWEAADAAESDSVQQHESEKGLWTQ